MRVFLAANILFSAAKSDGAVRALTGVLSGSALRCSPLGRPGGIMRLLVERGHECCADADAVAEARRNLMAKGPEASRVLDALLSHLRLAAAAPVAAGPAAELDWLPEKDRPVR